MLCQEAAKRRPSALTATRVLTTNRAARFDGQPTVELASEPSNAEAAAAPLGKPSVENAATDDAIETERMRPIKTTINSVHAVPAAGGP